MTAVDSPRLGQLDDRTSGPAAVHGRMGDDPILAVRPGAPHDLPRERR